MLARGQVHAGAALQIGHRPVEQLLTRALAIGQYRITAAQAAPGNASRFRGMHHGADERVDPRGENVCQVCADGFLQFLGCRE